MPGFTPDHRASLWVGGYGLYYEPHSPLANAVHKGALTESPDAMLAKIAEVFRIPAHVLEENRQAREPHRCRTQTRA